VEVSISRSVDLIFTVRTFKTYHSEMRHEMREQQYSIVNDGDDVRVQL
jgi:hypothetical protein